MTRYSTEPETRKYVKEHEFSSYARNLSDKYGEKLLDTTIKTGLYAAKTASKKVVHKTAETTVELIGNKIAQKSAKPKSVPEANSRDVEEIVIPAEKRQELLNDLRQML